MTPRLNWDERAEDDLNDMYDYVGVQNQSPSVAQQYIEALRRACEPYARQPLMGTLEPLLGEDLRSFTFRRRYVVIYRPLDDGIDVLRIIHASRQWRRIFRGG